MNVRFYSCGCGKHGYIVLPDGSRGLHSCCKQHALYLVRTGEVFKTFREADLVTLMGEIVASALPETLDDVDVLNLFNVELVNQVELAGAHLIGIGETLCGLINDPNGRILIPPNFLESTKETLNRVQ